MNQYNCEEDRKERTHDQDSLWFNILHYSYKYEVAHHNEQLLVLVTRWHQRCIIFTLSSQIIPLDIRSVIKSGWDTCLKLPPMAIQMNLLFSSFFRYFNSISIRLMLGILTKPDWLLSGSNIESKTLTVESFSISSSEAPSEASPISWNWSNCGECLIHLDYGTLKINKIINITHTNTLYIHIYLPEKTGQILCLQALVYGQVARDSNLYW